MTILVNNESMVMSAAAIVTTGYPTAVSMAMLAIETAVLLDVGSSWRRAHSPSAGATMLGIAPFAPSITTTSSVTALVTDITRGLYLPSESSVA